MGVHRRCVTGDTVILSQHTLDGITTGRITRAFRRWRRPTVKTGGTLLTSAGRLCITQVRVVASGDVTAADARAAGYLSVAELLADLPEGDGQLYCIEFGPLSADPRVALRAATPTASEATLIIARLARMDARASWTIATLDLIDRWPGVRAGDLARELGVDREPFKINVRKLKALGLTLSLETGYALSPRGLAVLRQLRKRPT